MVPIQIISRIPRENAKFTKRQLNLVSYLPIQFVCGLHVRTADLAPKRTGNLSNLIFRRIRVAIVTARTINQNGESYFKNGAPGRTTDRVRQNRQQDKSVRKDSTSTYNNNHIEMSSWLEVSLPALRHNVAQLRSRLLPTTLLCGVVKVRVRLFRVYCEFCLSASSGVRNHPLKLL
jgi:hypothetical protein